MDSPSRSFVRSLSLRAPITTEEERALFQQRLALTMRVIFLLAFAFWAINVVLLTAIHPALLPRVFMEPSLRVHLLTTAAAAVGWLLVRRGQPSARTLDVLDAVATLALCAGWDAMLVVREGRPEHNLQLIPLLAVTFTLTTRAALVPSTPARTAVLGALGMGPVVAVAHVLALRVPDGSTRALDAAIDTAIWTVIGVANVTVVSYVIYGLRLEVRKAMRLGQYILDEKIGEGGMGVVYRAHHAMLRRATAIKLLTGTTGTAAARFEREVHITARLTHPNTIAVYDYGRTPDGVFYYAMEYLEGISLEDLVERHGAQPPARVVHVLLQMCGALEEAHAAGLVHRDIKPANAMLTERGGVPDVVKVLDFGLVKETTTSDPALSAVNTIVGTPQYMSPEAILDPSRIDGRADLYGLGATAFFLLTGEHVFDGASLVEVCSKHLHQAPDKPSARRAGIPAVLDDIVLACLAKKPEERPASAEELGERLRAAAIPEWTRADARAWWKAHGTEVVPHRAEGAPRAVSDSAPSPTGKTVAIALEDRA